MNDYETDAYEWAIIQEEALSQNMHDLGYTKFPQQHEIRRKMRLDLFAYELDHYHNLERNIPC